MTLKHNGTALGYGSVAFDLTLKFQAIIPRVVPSSW